jgi:hypothetical protein
MEDYSQAAVLEGDNPLEFVDLAVFVVPAPAAGETLFVRHKRDRAKQERANADAIERLLRRPDGDVASRADFDIRLLPRASGWSWCARDKPDQTAGPRGGQGQEVPERPGVLMPANAS